MRWVESRLISFHSPGMQAALAIARFSTLVIRLRASHISSAVPRILAQR